MRVLHMLPTFDAGGLGSLALELVRAWPRGDVHSVVASRFPNTKPVLRREFERLVGERVREVHRTLLYPMSFVDALRDTAHGLGPFDGAVIYNFFDHVWYSMGLRRAGFTGSLMCHVGTVLPATDVVTKMLGSPFTGGVKFIPASGAVADGLMRAGADPARMTPVVWNGVNLSDFSLKMPRLDDDEEPVRFGFVGRMAPEAKDFEGLLRAYAKLEGAARERARLVLAGDGPLRSDYETLARKLGLMVGDRNCLAPGGVAFVGPVRREDVPQFLLSLDVFVMAALPVEGMSMALVEALVTGLPVIATDVPSNREVLHGRAGFLAQGVDGLHDAIEWLALDGEARARLAAMSRRCREQFDARRVAIEYRKHLGGVECGAEPHK